MLLFRQLLQRAVQVALAIEDDPEALIAWAFVLRSLGFTVLEAGSRGEAWRVCQKHQGPIHLVVAKSNHRTSDFIARLRLMCPQICAVCVSEVSSVEFDDQQIPRDFVSLQKPFRLETLADTLRELLAKPKIRAGSSIS